MWLEPVITAFALNAIAVDASPVTPLDHPVHAELAAESDWEHAYTSDAVVVYKKSLKSVDHIAWMGRTSLPETVSPAALLALLEDTGSHAQYNRSLAASVVLDRTGGVTTFYQVVQTPNYVPLSDRWWIAQARNLHGADDPPARLRRIWATVPSTEMPTVGAHLATTYPKAIEIAFSAGRWELRPREDGSTEVIYCIVTDPGGAVPRSLSARFAGRSVSENLRAILRSAENR